MLTQQIDIFATIVHSVSEISGAEMQAITVHYGGNGYIAPWRPGNPITKGAVHFTQASPATDRNDVETWRGESIRMISMTTALIETKGL